MQPVLSIEDLSLSYGTPEGRRLPVLRGARLSISKGEVVGLLGPSGSGKTSLLRYILGVQVRGSESRCAALRFEGNDLLSMSVRQRHRLRRSQMGIVLQDPVNRLSPFRNVSRQLQDAGGAYNSRAAALTGLQRVGFTDPERIASSYPDKLSGGECQRVAIAQAIAASPTLLLADEPTSALDTVAQRQILDLLLRIRHEQQIAMLVISHDPELLAVLADRILRLSNGVISENLPALASTHKPRPSLAATPTDLGRTTVEPLLAVEHLALTFGLPRHGIHWMNLPAWVENRKTHPALRDVTLAVPTGSFVAIVGASGSGKSTLARCIAGIDLPQSGEILFAGKTLQPRRSQESRAQIQLILQDTVGALNPRLTGAQILEEPMRIHRDQHLRLDQSSAKLRHERIQQVLAQVSLAPHFMDRTPAQMSGGERQRIAIARALILRPALLLLDEALTGLDHQLQDSILELLENLRRHSRLTCLHCTHDLRRMLLTADQIAVMDEGRIVEVHAAAEFAQKASHPASLRLLEAMLLDAGER